MDALMGVVWRQRCWSRASCENFSKDGDALMLVGAQGVTYVERFVSDGEPVSGG